MSILRAFVHALVLWLLLRFGLGWVEAPALGFWLALVAGALGGGAVAGGLAGGAILGLAVLADPGAREAFAGLSAGEGLPAALGYGLAIVGGLVGSIVVGAMGREEPTGPPPTAESAVAQAGEMDRLAAAGQVDEAVASAMTIGRPRMAHDLLVGAKRKDDAAALLRHVGLARRTPGGAGAGAAAPEGGAAQAPQPPPLELDPGAIALDTLAEVDRAPDPDEPGLGERMVAPEDFRDADEPLFEFEEPSGAVDGDSGEGDR